MLLATLHSYYGGIAQWGDVFERETKGFTFKNIPKITNAITVAIVNKYHLARHTINGTELSKN